MNKPQPITRNIRKPGFVPDFNFCTFTQNINGLISRSFEIPASAYYHPLSVIPQKLYDHSKKYQQFC